MDTTDDEFPSRTSRRATNLLRLFPPALPCLIDLFGGAQDVEDVSPTPTRPRPPSTTKDGPDWTMGSDFPPNRSRVPESDPSPSRCRV